MKDFFGTEICKGDYLFYAIRSGSVAHAKVGKVIDLKEKAVTIISVKTFWKVVTDSMYRIIIVNFQVQGAL